ncbi:hypothetical protein C8Q77DRAFT_1181024 [Trametes polyzona]|nr:hypothetical protein C8Q77DRAFT_1181024 [Trametes polyzona]
MRGKARATVSENENSSGGEEPEDSDSPAVDDDDDAERTDDDDGLEHIEHNPKALANLFAEEAVHWGESDNVPAVKPGNDAKEAATESANVLRRASHPPHPTSRAQSPATGSAEGGASSRAVARKTAQSAPTSKSAASKKRTVHEDSDADNEADVPVTYVYSPHYHQGFVLEVDSGTYSVRAPSPTYDTILTCLLPQRSDPDQEDPQLSSSDDSGIELVAPREGRFKLREQHRRVRRVIQRAIDITLAEVCLQNAFPDTSQQHLKIVYHAVLKAAEELDDQDVVRRLKKKDDYALELCKIPYQRIPIFRGNVRKLVEGVPITTFGMRLGDKERGEWLLRNHRFLFPYDYGAKTVEAGKIYDPPIFVEILRLAFFKQPDAFGFEISNRFYSSLPEKPDEIELPAPMLALVATAIYAAIDDCMEHRTHARDFTANNYWGKYKDFMNELSSIRTNGPQQYHVLMHGLWRRISDPSGSRGQAAPPHTSLVDIAAMARE